MCAWFLEFYLRTWVTHVVFLFKPTSLFFVSPFFGPLFSTRRSRFIYYQDIDAFYCRRIVQTLFSACRDSHVDNHLWEAKMARYIQIWQHRSYSVRHFGIVLCFEAKPGDVLDLNREKELPCPWNWFKSHTQSVLRGRISGWVACLIGAVGP